MDLSAIVSLRPVTFNPQERQVFLEKIYREAAEAGLRSIADRYGIALKEDNHRAKFRPSFMARAL